MASYSSKGGPGELVSGGTEEVRGFLRPRAPDRILDVRALHHPYLVWPHHHRYDDGHREQIRRLWRSHSTLHGRDLHTRVRGFRAEVARHRTQCLVAAHRNCSTDRRNRPTHFHGHGGRTRPEQVRRQSEGNHAEWCGWLRGGRGNESWP